jgi:hypothetical protein
MSGNRFEHATLADASLDLPIAIARAAGNAATTRAAGLYLFVLPETHPPARVSLAGSQNRIPQGPSPARQDHR